GLNKYESELYTALLKLGSSTAGELASKSNVPRSRVYDVLISLEKKGFALIQVGRPVKYTATAPDKLVGSIVSNYEDDHKERLSDFERIKGNLLKSLSSIHGTEGSEDDNLVGIIRGKSNIYSQMKNMISDSKSSIVKIASGESAGHFEKHCSGHIEGAKKRGVNTRLIINSDGKDSDSKSSADSRLSKNSHGRFFVKDGEELLAFLKGGESALWIRDSSLAGSFAGLFESVWQNSK
ncbi:MAG: helix-turn-helix domain-containing protein, partial [archaeon]|nr:helix-turn-helix domain-containing protein [archaeon]